MLETKKREKSVKCEVICMEKVKCTKQIKNNDNNDKRKRTTGAARVRRQLRTVTAHARAVPYTC